MDPAVLELREALLADPPQIPSKYFYDGEGSALFEQITETPEYYPTRTEIALIERHAAEIMALLRPVELAELGSGSGRKTELLVEAGRAVGSLRRVALLDIAEEFLHASAERMAARWPDLELHPVVGDFTGDLDRLGDAPGRRLLVFLAGTVGNLDSRASARFFADARALLGPDDALLLGVDLVKSEPLLIAAYDDAAGVTAAFNRNILEVVNQRFGGTFDPTAFRHRAHWNEVERRIEMWLDATRPTAARVAAADIELRFAPGEGVRTELSCKYSRELLERRLQRAGLHIERWMPDDDGLFALALVAPDPHPLVRLQRAWARTDALFELLGDDAWLQRGIPLRHPPIFYLGHLPAFAWNQIGRAALSEPPLDAELERLFERGIDPLTTTEASALTRDAWPALDDIYAYRDRVRAAIAALGPRLDALAADSDDAILARGRVLHLVAEHELMHHETLLYLFAALPPHMLRRPAEGPFATEPTLAAHDGAPSPRVDVPAGATTVGSTWDDHAFAWDAELPATRVDVDAFTIDARPVTVAQYAAALDAHPDWALPEGWRRDDAMPSGVALRWLFGWLDRDSVGAWPVQLAHHEAERYAASLGARLPTEAELHRAREVAAPARAIRDEALDYRATAPLPCRRAPAGRVVDLVGNGWEWTSTPFFPLPGFVAWVPGYKGYAADFFDGHHRVVFGGSWATDKSLLRPGFRNWYQRHYPYVFSKFRLVWPAA